MPCALRFNSCYRFIFGKFLQLFFLCLLFFSTQVYANCASWADCPSACPGPVNVCSPYCDVGSGECFPCQAGTVWNSTTHTCDCIIAGQYLNGGSCCPTGQTYWWQTGGCTNCADAGDRSWNNTTHTCDCPANSTFNGTSCVCTNPNDYMNDGGCCSTGNTWNPTPAPGTCESCSASGRTWDSTQTKCVCSTGTWNGTTCVGPPTINSVIDTGTLLNGIGWNDVETQVDIDGTNFVSGATVEFGTRAGSIVSLSSNLIQAKTPAIPSIASGNVETVNVKVTNPGGANVTYGSGFKYVDVPTLSLISPASGITTGGTAVSLTGEFCAETGCSTKVKFDGITNSSASVANSSTINLTTTLHTAGPSSVKVYQELNSITKSTDPSTFTFTPPTNKVVFKSGPTRLERSVCDDFVLEYRNPGNRAIKVPSPNPLSISLSDVNDDVGGAAAGGYFFSTDAQCKGKIIPSPTPTPIPTNFPYDPTNITTSPDVPITSTSIPVGQKRVTVFYRNASRPYPNPTPSANPKVVLKAVVSGLLPDGTMTLPIVGPAQLKIDTVSSSYETYQCFNAKVTFLNPIPTPTPVAVPTRVSLSDSLLGDRNGKYYSAGTCNAGLPSTGGDEIPDTNGDSKQDFLFKAGDKIRNVWYKRSDEQSSLTLYANSITYNSKQKNLSIVKPDPRKTKCVSATTPAFPEQCVGPLKFHSVSALGNPVDLPAIPGTVLFPLSAERNGNSFPSAQLYNAGTCDASAQVDPYIIAGNHEGEYWFKPRYGENGTYLIKAKHPTVAPWELNNNNDTECPVTSTACQGDKIYDPATGTCNLCPSGKHRSADRDDNRYDSNVADTDPPNDSIPWICCIAVKENFSGTCKCSPDYYFYGGVCYPKPKIYSAYCNGDQNTQCQGHTGRYLDVIGKNFVPNHPNDPNDPDDTAELQVAFKTATGDAKVLDNKYIVPNDGTGPKGEKLKIMVPSSAYGQNLTLKIKKKGAGTDGWGEKANAFSVTFEKPVTPVVRFGQFDANRKLYIDVFDGTLNDRTHLRGVPYVYIPPTELQLPPIVFGEPELYIPLNQKGGGFQPLQAGRVVIPNNVTNNASYDLTNATSFTSSDGYFEGPKYTKAATCPAPYTSCYTPPALNNTFLFVPTATGVQLDDRTAGVSSILKFDPFSNLPHQERIVPWGAGGTPNTGAQIAVTWGTTGPQLEITTNAPGVLANPTFPDTDEGTFTMTDPAGKVTIVAKRKPASSSVPIGPIVIKTTVGTIPEITHVVAHKKTGTQRIVYDYSGTPNGMSGIKAEYTCTNDDDPTTCKVANELYACAFDATASIDGDNPTTYPNQCAKLTISTVGDTITFTGENGNSLSYGIDPTCGVVTSMSNNFGESQSITLNGCTPIGSSTSFAGQNYSVITTPNLTTGGTQKVEIDTPDGVSISEVKAWDLVNPFLPTKITHSSGPNTGSAEEVAWTKLTPIPGKMAYSAIRTSKRVLTGSEMRGVTITTLSPVTNANVKETISELIAMCTSSDKFCESPSSSFEVSNVTANWNWATNGMPAPFTIKDNGSAITTTVTPGPKGFALPKLASTVTAFGKTFSETVSTSPFNFNRISVGGAATMITDFTVTPGATTTAVNTETYPQGGAVSTVTVGSTSNSGTNTTSEVKFTYPTGKTSTSKTGPCTNTLVAGGKFKTNCPNTADDFVNRSNSGSFFNEY